MPRHRWPRSLATMPSPSVARSPASRPCLSNLLRRLGALYRSAGTTSPSRCRSARTSNTVPPTASSSTSCFCPQVIQMESAVISPPIAVEHPTGVLEHAVRLDDAPAGSGRRSIRSGGMSTASMFNMGPHSWSQNA